MTKTEKGGNVIGPQAVNMHAPAWAENCRRSSPTPPHMRPLSPPQLAAGMSPCSGRDDKQHTHNVVPCHAPAADVHPHFRSSSLKRKTDFTPREGGGKQAAIYSSPRLLASRSAPIRITLPTSALPAVLLLHRMVVSLAGFLLECFPIPLHIGEISRAAKDIFLPG